LITPSFREATWGDDEKPSNNGFRTAMGASEINHDKNGTDAINIMMMTITE
jgi:hypothetical protein